jgi:hypothetical protein
VTITRPVSGSIRANALGEEIDLLLVNRRRFLLPALLAAVALSACSARATDAPALNVPVASEAPAAAEDGPAGPATPVGNMSERGNVIKQLGETGGFGPTQDNIAVTFAVDKITVDAKCTAQYAQKSEHGHFVKVDLRAETKSTMPPNMGYGVSGYEFTTVGEDGITEQTLVTGPAFSCLDESEQFPATLNPGSKYRGSIVLDTKNPEGVLVFRPMFMGGAGGWEWAYGR